MFRRLSDFVEAYDNLTDTSTKVFMKLTDGNLSQSVAPGFRTLGQIAWHIVVTVPEMMSRTGLDLSVVDHRSPPPASASAITAAYRQVSSELLQAVKASWDDDSLLQTDDMYGEEWERGKTLAALIYHEIHHRGQMTVLLRQADSEVPGVFGPSKEEWSAFGMDAPPW